MFQTLSTGFFNFFCQFVNRDCVAFKHDHMSLTHKFHVDNVTKFHPVIVKQKYDFESDVIRYMIMALTFLYLLSLMELIDWLPPWPYLGKPEIIAFCTFINILEVDYE